ncbi:hypothetical protein L210DRAFT_862160 [Boletus edulis BED1]|uniref:GSKIP domain-containing protein n=1 Tax=Boletus edulis BED1 TaxID=1328754 RepID=A0AAD4BYN0_BOLED|nr:hypothetical protein L210DRAFT_862160 [Boletus edulis BED1]
MDPSSSSFYHDELSRVLSEQSFGLTRYEVAGQSSAHEATAAVTLLEGTNINVSLNIRGYQLDDGQTHESIEELLQSISPKYVQKRQELIIAKLQSLQ